MIKYYNANKTDHHFYMILMLCCIIAFAIQLPTVQKKGEVTVVDDEIEIIFVTE